MPRLALLSLLILVLLLPALRVCAPSREALEDRLLLAELNREEGLAYRDANRRHPQVLTTASGLQVEVLSAGDGPIPGPDDWVQLHYRAAHLDGREYANTWPGAAPVTVAVARTIPGWREALTGLPVGSRAQLVVPPELAYGPAGGGAIGPAETLLFELELLAIDAPPVAPPPDPLQQAVPGLR
ncbi:MAG: FKBP-type peptidyl-prolyl cis-trans isomerase [Chromatiaceae bacterium]|nr:MAG: FKBP-type peptidyl-prolyl cis-trans isomerase [Chromatiaceae bacterium]